MNKAEIRIVDGAHRDDINPACMFYVNCGFHIGGLDTNVYKGTPQENKSDILFYLDF